MTVFILNIFRRIHKVNIILLCVFLFSNLSCSHSKSKEGVLLRIGENELTENDVLRSIPTGLHPSDSLALFQNIVEGWIKDELLTEFAEERLLDIERIDRKVKDYRSNLIVEEYLRRMAETHKSVVNEKKIKEYYDTHKKDLKTEIPLVRGVFIKINKESKGRNEIKKLLSEDDDRNIDLFERTLIDEAIEYEYFKDKWVDWERITGLIPFRFGDPEQFLSSHKFFETDYGDCTYFLQVTDYLPSGAEQPYDYASHWISALLNQKDINAYASNLVESLIKKSIQEHKLEIVGYDPISRTMVQHENL